MASAVENSQLAGDSAVVVPRPLGLSPRRVRGGPPCSPGGGSAGAGGHAGLCPGSVPHARCLPGTSGPGRPRRHRAPGASVPGPRAPRHAARGCLGLGDHSRAEQCGVTSAPTGKPHAGRRAAGRPAFYKQRHREPGHVPVLSDSHLGERAREPGPWPAESVWRGPRSSRRGSSGLSASVLGPELCCHGAIGHAL